MKISVVMQSYLGDYPGSRSRPEFKFVRAVSSFLSQLHDDKELVIVSDGCDKTKVLYETLYADDPRVKFCYLSKSGPKMYEVDGGGKKFYRGLPRQVGCTIASGDIITYMDSDDIMLPNRLSDLYTTWSSHPQTMMWCSNAVRYLHHAVLKSETFPERRMPVKDSPILNLRNFGYDIPDLFWPNEIVAEGYVSCATYSLSHKKSVKASWKDSFVLLDSSGKKLEGVSEDVVFLRELMDLDGPGIRQESLSYVVCHYKGIWDV